MMKNFVCTGKIILTAIVRWLTSANVHPIQSSSVTKTPRPQHHSNNTTRGGSKGGQEGPPPVKFVPPCGPPPQKSSR